MQKFIITEIDTNGKVKTSISFIDNFEVMELQFYSIYLDEVSLFGTTHDNHPMDLRLKLDLLTFFIVHEPLRYSSFAMPVLEQDESDLY